MHCSRNLLLTHRLQWSLLSSPWLGAILQFINTTTVIKYSVFQILVIYNLLTLSKFIDQYIIFVIYISSSLVFFKPSGALIKLWVRLFRVSVCPIYSTGTFTFRFSALVWPCLGLFPFVPTFLSSRFLITLLLLFSCLILLLLHPCCSHARGIMCGIDTPYIVYPFLDSLLF